MTADRLGSGIEVGATFQKIPRPVSRLGLGLGLGLGWEPMSWVG